jgi:hypothetical protein
MTVLRRHQEKVNHSILPKVCEQLGLNIIQSIDHILNHDLVWEISLAARFVSEMEREMQDIKERFNTQILSLLGSRKGQEKELWFPSFNNKKRKFVDKRFKGYAG